jgi:hypothetical protein
MDEFMDISSLKTVRRKDEKSAPAAASNSIVGEVETRF